MMDIVDMVDNIIMAENVNMVDTIGMVNIQQTFGYFKFLVDNEDKMVMVDGKDTWSNYAGND